MKQFSHTVLAGYGCALLATAALADQSPETAKPDTAARQTTSEAASAELKDVWIDARLETAYLFNRHLNNFSIQTDVNSGNVLLTGTVGSEIDKDLAVEIARGVPGVQSVQNHLVLKSDTGAALEDAGAALEDAGATLEKEAEDLEFGDMVNDATTTAKVKSNLVRNRNLDGMSIEVETREAVVTLSGEVKTAEEKQLAGIIARNTGEVKSVTNQLNVTPADKQS